MPISPDTLSKLSEQQPQIWQTVSLTVTETAGKSLMFADAVTTAEKTQDLYVDFGSPLVAIQFAFSNLPENPMAILIPQESTEGIAAVVLDADVEGVDENTVAEIRTSLEGIVQGICLAVGALRTDAIVASGLSIRHQLFSFPASMQRCDELVKVKIEVSSDKIDSKCAIYWIMDQDAANLILGRTAEDMEGPFSQIPTPGGQTDSGARRYEDMGSLDLLMDIPLEITVELGRMKMLVKDVVELGTGSIVELDKAAGEPVDVIVNGRLVARGEVVVIEDNFGVRITEILNPHERLQRLSEAA